MTPERWQQIKEVFNSAIRLEPGQRPVFLSRACESDQDLRVSGQTIECPVEGDIAFQNAELCEAI